MRSGALGNYRAADTVVVIQIDAGCTQASVNEMPVDQVGGEYEIADQLLLDSEIDVLRGPWWNVHGIQSRRGLFGDLNRA